MLQSIMNLRNWLKQVQTHTDDGRWLSKHEDVLYSIVASSLQRPPEFHDAVELLMAVFPHYAFVLYHVKRWSPLLLDALVQAQTLRDNEMQIRILTYLGENYLTRGRYSAARNAFKIALERAKDGQTKEMILAAYTGLIRMQSVHLADSFDPHLFAKSLTLSKQVDDLALKAGLHESLAFAYIKATQIATAIGHGQTAYGYWHRLGNELEMAKTAYLLATAYRFIGQLVHAEAWLQKTASQFEKTDYNRQYTLLAYEEGVLYLQRKQYETAEQWLVIALREAIQIDSVDYIAASYHALALAQTGLGKYDESEANFKQAFVAWERIEDAYELASAHQAMGYLQIQRNDPTSARIWLKRAFELCKKIPEPTQRAFLEKYIEETVDEISD